MEALIRELIPHSPELGLHVDPYLDSDRVRNAVRDYAPDVAVEDVIALYDATMLRSAKDGAVFTRDLFVFQNHDLQAPQTIRYEDIVRVNSTKKFLGGRRVQVDVNRGRATIEAIIDFSGRPGAAGPVARFLSEAMLRGVDLGSIDRLPGERPDTSAADGTAPHDPGSTLDTTAPPHQDRATPERRKARHTDVVAVSDALEALHEAGKLTTTDLIRLRRTLDGRD